ncbi:MAG: hypothetical protein JXJ20_04105 [Anaerolineae bacterium]|nr:hypothetical protein [Anaerolineae bacterium]
MPDHLLDDHEPEQPGHPGSTGDAASPPDQAPDEEALAAEPPADGESVEVDTRPKPPPGLREAVVVEPSEPLPEASDVPPPPIEQMQFGPPDALVARLAAEEPPVHILDDTAEMVAAVSRSAARPLLLGVIMLGTLCICLMLVALAGFAGYRDGLATNDYRVTQTLATGIAEQYATGVADFQSGNFELAIARLEWIVKTIQPAPDYLRDSPALLAMASTMNAYTPTPTATGTPTPTAIPEPTLIPADVETPEPTGADPAYLYEQAETAMRQSDYEAAIEWLESLRGLDTGYRAAEATAMYMEALTRLGRMYLRGQNTDGEDQLARGVLLIYRADEIGMVEPASLLYEADFAERYLNARNYISGGNYAAAVPVLDVLCNENCDWAYRGVSVRDLLEQAQAGGG